MNNMQNDGKQRMKQRKRKKKTKASDIPTKHLFWSNFGKPAPTFYNKAAPKFNSLNKPSQFQTPEQQPELVDDLIDDNAPNNPMIDSGSGNPEKIQEQKLKPQVQTSFIDIDKRKNQIPQFQSPGIKSSYYQELDFTEDLHDIDFSNIVTDTNKPGTSYNKGFVLNKATPKKIGQITVQKPISILNNRTVQKPASKPIILSNELIHSGNKTLDSLNQHVSLSNVLDSTLNEGPIVSPIEPVKPVNIPIKLSSKPSTLVKKPLLEKEPSTVTNKIISDTQTNTSSDTSENSVDQSNTSSTQLVSGNQINTTLNKPEISNNQPITRSINPVVSVNQPITPNRPPFSLNQPSKDNLNEPNIPLQNLIPHENEPNTSYKPSVNNSAISTFANQLNTSKPTKKKPGDEVARNFITIIADSSTASGSNIINNKGSNQTFNRTLNTATTPIMESKNNLPNDPNSQISVMQQHGQMFYNRSSGPLPFSMPKGIPRSFLHMRPETSNIQPSPQMSGYQPNTIPNWGTPQTPQYPQFTPNPQTLAYNYLPYDNVGANMANTNTNPIVVQTDNLPDKPQQYSPSETYADNDNNDDEEEREGSESPDLLQSTQKRLSAFKRLGPQTQPKKPKLTINLMFNKEQAVREVVDETDGKVAVYKPVHLREEIISSKDDIVMKYLPLWPWKRNVAVKKQISIRQSKSVMILELEQLQDESYNKDNIYIQISIKGYPPSWKKEKVLDLMLDSVKGRSFIPIFIEFTETECKFFVIRSRQALVAIHKYGFVIKHKDVELKVVISLVDITVKHLDLIPRLVLRKMLSSGYDGERKLNLSAFTLGNDISHFIYYPLHRLTNQVELVQLQSNVAWDYLTDLDLSHNRLTNLSGFGFSTCLPKLRHLNVSHNHFDKVTVLLPCRDIPLNAIWLEGNPLCHHYIDPTHYIKVLKMMFPSIREIDGTPLHIPDKLPLIKKNYCPEDAVGIVEKFLEVFFPLLESGFDQRATIEDMYEPDAVMTITYKFKLRYGIVYRCYRNLFLRCRVIDEGDMEAVEGAAAIAKLVAKWPGLKHDPYTFTVDVMYHNDTTTIVRITGIVKLTAETLAEDEHLLAFTRTLVLHSQDGQEFKIKNEMVYWDEPTEEYAATAFKVTTVTAMPLSLKLESAPDDDLKEKLTHIFMQLTDMDKGQCVKCLDTKEWNLKNVLEYFTKLLKLDSIESI